MITIYRVHHKSSPYQGMYKSYVSNEMFDLTGTHPSPLDDAGMSEAWRGLNSWEKDLHRFGFSTLAQFSAWVFKEEWWQKLDDEGYMISRFSAPLPSSALPRPHFA